MTISFRPIDCLLLRPESREDVTRMILDNIVINTRPLGSPFRPRLNINDSHLRSPREDYIALILRIQPV